MNERILLLSHDPHTRQLLTDLWGVGGYEVLIAENDEEILRNLLDPSRRAHALVQHARYEWMEEIERARTFRPLLGLNGVRLGLVTAHTEHFLSRKVPDLQELFRMVAYMPFDLSHLLEKTRGMFE